MILDITTKKQTTLLLRPTGRRRRRHFQPAPTLTPITPGDEISQSAAPHSDDCISCFFSVPKENSDLVNQPLQAIPHHIQLVMTLEILFNDNISEVVGNMSAVLCELIVVVSDIYAF